MRIKRMVCAAVVAVFLAGCSTNTPPSAPEVKVTPKQDSTPSKKQDQDDPAPR